jgi:hypothetical protein
MHDCLGQRVTAGHGPISICRIGTALLSEVTCHVVQMEAVCSAILACAPRTSAFYGQVWFASHSRVDLCGGRLQARAVGAAEHLPLVCKHQLTI